jgi:hypothetical protein
MGQGFGWPNPQTDLWAPLGLAQSEFAIDRVWQQVSAAARH